MAVPLFDTSTPLAPIDAEIRAKVNEIIDSKRFIFGPEVEAFEREFAAYIGTSHAVGVANGTDALLLALRALGVGPGDEVIVPSFTFFASAEPIVLVGATPVWCDIDPSTFLMTADHVREVLTPRTKAVIAVHLFGNVAPIAEIEALGVPVIEDAAQSAGTDLADGRRPGALSSTLATFSFFPSKNLGAFGDGGAVTTNDAALAERIATLRFHGSHGQAHLRARRPQLPPRRAPGGHPARPAPAPRRLGRRPPRRRARLRRGRARRARLAPRPDPGRRTRLAPLRRRSSERADELIGVLKDANIGTAAYYRVPAHLQPAMRDYPPPSSSPGTEEASRTNLAMPMSPVLDRAQADEVVAAVGALAAV